MRPHVTAVYAFARCADDFSDEGDRPTAERLALLDDWRHRLYRVGDTPTDMKDERDEVFLAVGHSIQTCELPIELFDDLLSAFRQDVTTNRYDSWAQLLDYCRRSANPVGRLVLRIAGYRDEALDRASDCVCSALQIANFLQDLGIDWRRGRLYVPSEIFRACSANESELNAAAPLPLGWRDALAEMAARTQVLFDEGRSVCDGVRGRLGVELRMTWLGGVRILDRLERTGYDPLTARPTLGLADRLLLVWQALRWNRRSSSSC